MEVFADSADELMQWRSRAASGDGEASRWLAIVAASGAGVPHDLPAALGHLQQAAEQGCRAAQSELAALVGNWRLVAELAAGEALRAGMAERLRAAVDLVAWLRLPDGEVFSEAPRIAVARKFISPQHCDWLIRLGTPHLRAAQIYEPSGNLAEDLRRTNRAALLELAQTDTVLAFVRSRVAALANVKIAGLEGSQVLHYEVGQEFRPHHDFYDVANPVHAREVARAGQRALTVLIYLNDGYEGGHTAFPLLGRSFKGRKGDALLFWNVGEDGTSDARTLHTGTAPTRGEKWLFSQWVRIAMPPRAS
ncbi:MAG TPA: 2OG-Fe(II) oxygenase [Burkholderiales bacterium]|nr:2OG-Fe(II) oxygenase [Burkholderiales bacterium]